MKVAIMTQPLGKNYGGIIQAWALQQVLKSAGHEPVTIDRQADAKGPAYQAARLGFRALKKVVGKRKAPINFERHLADILRNTQAFIRQHLTMSEPLDSTAKLSAHFERRHYDAVIVGSDQTWRPRYSPNINDFFLGFLQGSDVKRIAYASSFGVEEWEFTENQTRRCAALAKQFNAISVRESSGVDLCQKHLGVEAAHVLDPTLLLERSSYEVLYKNKELPEREGIYTYILDQCDWKKQVIVSAQKIIQESVYSSQPKADLSRLTSEDPSDYKIPSLEEWLKGFGDASFIITDSFHGTIFALIHNKPFISLINDSRGASRFYSLLDALGLRERILEGLDEQAMHRLFTSVVDYSVVNERISALRSSSKDFLTETLGS